jgi:hypothetical protein
LNAAKILLVVESKNARDTDPSGRAVTSRYGVIGTEGVVVRKSGTMTSDARVKCAPKTMIIGVGCGKS